MKKDEELLPREVERDELVRVRDTGRVLWKRKNKGKAFALNHIIVTTPTTTQPQHRSWVGHENDFILALIKKFFECTH